ncbi:hypothetical protein [Mucilaginibacter sp.]|uniref:hypothetical protein n=1 Tax=Mucilaginibacter sp. TaxID=1882438 RepID=UPI0035BC8DF8
MKINLIVLLLLSMIYLGCTHRSNGKYVVYSVNKVSGNDTILTFLNKSLQGKRYNVTFNPKFVSIKLLNGSDEMLLTKTQDKIAKYTQRYTQGGGIFNIELLDDKDLTLIVSLGFKKSQPLIMPAQLGNMGPYPFNLNMLQ